MRRICAVLAVVVGVTLVTVPIATNLFARTSAAQRLTDRIRPAMTTQSLDQLRHEYETGREAGTQLINQALPALASRLGETPDQLNASIQANYPDVAAGFQQFPDIAAKVGSVLTLFEKDQKEFQAADSIPTTWLPFTVGPWLMELVGLVLIGLGLGMLGFGRLGRAGTRRPVVPVLATGLIGLALAVGPLAVSFPHKTSQSAALVDDLRPLITRPVADAVKGWQSAMEKMTAQLDDQLLPALAAQLNETPAQLLASLAPDFPAVANGLPQLRAVFVDFGDKTRRLDASVRDFAQTKRIPFRALPWLFIPPGIALVAGSALTLAGERQHRLVPVVVASSTLGSQPGAEDEASASRPPAGLGAH